MEINKIILEAVDEYLRKKERKYECINRADSFGGSMKIMNEARKLSVSHKNGTVMYESASLKEAVDWETEADERGGIIIFSTEVNALGGTGFINTLKKKISSFMNKLTATKKIDAIAKKYNPNGWTIGKGYLKGHYVGKNGETYSEDSISLEIVGVKDDIIIKAAEDLCHTFNQESVLVKLHDGRILFVNGN